MGVSVRIPVLLRSLTGGAGEVNLEAGTVAELIEGLDARFPGIKERLYDEDGALRRFINLYVNTEDIRFLKGDATALKEGDEVSIVPAIAGGVTL